MAKRKSSWGLDKEHFKPSDSDNKHWGIKYIMPPVDKQDTAAPFLQTKYRLKSEKSASDSELQLLTVNKLKHCPSNITEIKNNKLC